MPEPVGRAHHVIYDTADPIRLARFYSALLGLPITFMSTDFAVVSVSPSTSGYAFALAPDHQPPVRDDPSRPQQVHLDVMVDDVATAAARVQALGATCLDPERAVWADPSGHPFCLIPRPGWAPPVGGAGLAFSRPARPSPRPARGPTPARRTAGPGAASA